MMANTSSRKSLRLVIYGRVQGVYYRESIRVEAQNLGVTGWVRNRQDGAVEAVVQGESVAVDAIVRWAQHGPVHARVERVVIESDEECNYSNFEVIR